MGVKTEPKTEPETGPLKKACPSEQKIPRSRKGSKKEPQKGGTLWGAFLFSVALLFFARFWGLPSLLWTIIYPHFQFWALIFLGFLGSGFTSGGEIPCSKKGSEMGPQNEVQCGLLVSSTLCCCLLLDFGAFRAYFGRKNRLYFRALGLDFLVFSGLKFPSGGEG